MDYEKKYNEALERARAMYESQDDAELAAYIFPELAESEDERIRREIRDFICWATDRGSITAEQRAKSDSWIAYLEKQKEQKEIPLMDGDTDTYFDDLRITTKPLTSREWFDEGIKYAQRLQKEQKPAEWMRSQMPMPEDTVIFMKGVAEGRRLEREDRNDDNLPRYYGD